MFDRIASTTPGPRRDLFHSILALAAAAASEDVRRIEAAKADVAARADDWGRAREMAAGEGQVTT